MITAEMVHECYQRALGTYSQSWLELSHEQVRNYQNMAQELNDAIKLKQATQEPGYVWSAEA